MESFAGTIMCSATELCGSSSLRGFRASRNAPDLNLLLIFRMVISDVGLLFYTDDFTQVEVGIIQVKVVKTQSCKNTIIHSLIYLALR